MSEGLYAVQRIYESAQRRMRGYNMVAAGGFGVGGGLVVFSGDYVLNGALALAFVLAGAVAAREGVEEHKDMKKAERLIRSLNEHEQIELEARLNPSP